MKQTTFSTVWTRLLFSNFMSEQIKICPILLVIAHVILVVIKTWNKALVHGNFLLCTGRKTKHRRRFNRCKTRGRLLKPTISSGISDEDTPLTLWVLFNNTLLWITNIQRCYTNLLREYICISAYIRILYLNKVQKFLGELTILSDWTICKETRQSKISWFITISR